MALSRKQGEGWPKEWPKRLAEAMRHARDVLGRSSIVTAGKDPYNKFLPKVDGQASWKRFQGHLPTDEEIEERQRRLEEAMAKAEALGRHPGPLPGIALVLQPGQVHIDWDDVDQLLGFCRLYHEREGVALTVVRSRSGGHPLFDLPEGIVMRCSGAKEAVPELVDLGRPNCVKSLGGYTIGPPSVHMDDPNVQYRWVRYDPDADDLIDCDAPRDPPRVAPAWFVKWLSAFVVEGTPARMRRDARARDAISEADAGARSPEERFRDAVAPWIGAAALRRFVAAARGRAVVHHHKTAPDGAEVNRNNDLHDFVLRHAGVIPEAGIAEVLVAYSQWKHRPPLEVDEIRRTVARSGEKYVARAREKSAEGPAMEEHEPVALDIFTMADPPPDKPLERALVDGLVAHPSKVVLYGPGGVGKTWLALDLAISVAAGAKWGGELRCRQGRVLVLEAEMSPGVVTHRLRALASARGIGDELQALPIAISTSRHRVITQDRYKNIPVVRAVEAAWREAIEAQRPALLIIDSLSAFFGAEETNVGFKVLDDLLSRLVADYGLTTLVLHHTPKPIQGRKPDLPRGSGVLRDSMDTLLLLDGGKLLVKKQRLLPEGDGYEVWTAGGQDRFSLRLSPLSAGSNKVEWRVEETLKGQDRPLSKRRVRQLVRGDNAVVDSALQSLVRRELIGWVSWGSALEGYVHGSRVLGCVKEHDLPPEWYRATGIPPK